MSIQVILGSVDHDLRLKADHNPRLGHWTARLSLRPELAEGLAEARGPVGVICDLLRLTTS
jgi:hypothetical protein